MKRPALIFVFEKNNKYSINALLGAIETKGFLHQTDILLSNPKDLPPILCKVVEKYEKIAIAISFFYVSVWGNRQINQTNQVFLATNIFLLQVAPMPVGIHYPVSTWGLI